MATILQCGQEPTEGSVAVGVRWMERYGWVLGPLWIGAAQIPYTELFPLPLNPPETHAVPGLLEIAPMAVPPCVSPDGRVVAGTYLESGKPRAFSWGETGFTDLGTLVDGTSAYVRGIGNGANTIVGIADQHLGTEAQWRPFQYTAGTQMEAALALPHVDHASALGVSENGARVVGTGITQLGYHHKPFVWENGEPTFIAPKGDFGYLGEAVSISPDGTHVVGWGHSEGLSRITEGFVWHQEQFVPYRHPGSNMTKFLAVSRSGKRVVGVFDHDGDRHYQAFVWDPQTKTAQVLPFPQGSDSVWVSQISGDGKIVAGSYRLPDGTWSACVWNADGAVIPLDPWLHSQKIGDPNDRLESVSGVSEDGSVLVGKGVFDGNDRYYILHVGEDKSHFIRVKQTALQKVLQMKHFSAQAFGLFLRQQNTFHGDTPHVWGNFLQEARETGYYIPFSAVHRTDSGIEWGGGIGYLRTEYTEDQDRFTYQSPVWTLSMRYQPHPTGFHGLSTLSYGRARATMLRVEHTERYESDLQIQNMGWRLEGGYYTRFPNRILVYPYIAFNAARDAYEAFTETGSKGFAHRVSERESACIEGRLGVLVRDLPFFREGISVYGGGALVHRIWQGADPLTVALEHPFGLPTTRISVEADPLPQHLFEWQIGVSAEIRDCKVGAEGMLITRKGYIGTFLSAKFEYVF